jgi:predicted nucleotidyltransferase
MKVKKKSSLNEPDPAVVADIVERIVQAAKPERVVLFGSGARGTMGPNSDLDFLVIKAGKFHRRRLVATIYEQLSETESAVDIVVATPEEVERYRHSHCIVICPAMREGKVVYEA